MDKFLKAVGAVVFASFVLAILAVIGAYPTKWLVNYLISPGALTAIFGIPALTFWKALALNYICGTLFKASCSSK